MYKGPHPLGPKQFCSSLFPFVGSIFGVNKLLCITSISVFSSSWCVCCLYFSVRVSVSSVCVRRWCVRLWQAACGQSVLFLSSCSLALSTPLSSTSASVCVGAAFCRLCRARALGGSLAGFPPWRTRPNSVQRARALPEGGLAQEAVVLEEACPARGSRRANEPGSSPTDPRM